MDSKETKVKLEEQMKQKIKDYSAKKTKDMVDEIKYEVGISERPKTTWEEHIDFINTSLLYELDKKTVKKYQIVLSNRHSGWLLDLKKNLIRKTHKK